LCVGIQLGPLTEPRVHVVRLRAQVEGVGYVRPLTTSPIPSLLLGIVFILLPYSPLSLSLTHTHTHTSNTHTHIHTHTLRHLLAYCIFDRGNGRRIGEELSFLFFVSDAKKERKKFFFRWKGEVKTQPDTWVHFKEIVGMPLTERKINLVKFFYLQMMKEELSHNKAFQRICLSLKIYVYIIY